MERPRYHPGVVQAEIPHELQWNQLQDEDDWKVCTRHAPRHSYAVRKELS